MCILTTAKTFAIFVVAPSGTPQNLRVVFMSATSIIIQWDEVECRERNGVIFGYQVMSSSIDTPTVGTMFTASGLLPRTSYTFSVEAVNSSLVRGPPASIMVETSVPERESLLECIQLLG